MQTHYGGLIFKAGAPNTLIIGGVSTEDSGRFYEVPVVRGAGNHIVAFGTPFLRGFGANNDGGIAYGPGGVLFYSQYGLNAVAQVKPGSNADDKVVALGPLGIVYSTGALNFVPAGYNGAGQLKVSSWDGGQFYTVTLTADGSGTYNLTGATQVAILGGGPEGFAYVPLGSPLFGSQSMHVSAYCGRKSRGEHDRRERQSGARIATDIHRGTGRRRRCGNRSADGRLPVLDVRLRRRRQPRHRRAGFHTSRDGASGRPEPARPDRLVVRAGDRWTGI